MMWIVTSFESLSGLFYRERQAFDGRDNHLLALLYFFVALGAPVLAPREDLTRGADIGFGLASEADEPFPARVRLFPVYADRNRHGDDEDERGKGDNGDDH